MKKHIPVMVEEVIEYLNLKPGQKIIDATCGLGGHSKEILKKIGPKGKLLAIDQDQGSLNEAKKNLVNYEGQITFVCDNFKNIKEIAEKNNFNDVDGILFDLGIASWHFESSERGFTFSKNEILDMRLKSQNEKQKYKDENKTAEYVINNYSYKKLSEILKNYGDIRKSDLFAKKILDARRKKRIQSTFELKEALGIENPKVLAPMFQAIRIEVNNEYENLKYALKGAREILKPKSRLAVISFHSGEDRIVKNFLRDNNENILVITKKPMIPSVKEIQINSKSRSAKLRIGEKY